MCIIGSEFCGFYYSHIHAEEVQDPQKSVLTLYVKDSAWWLIVINLKILLDLFCPHILEGRSVRNLIFQPF